MLPVRATLQSNDDPATTTPSTARRRFGGSTAERKGHRLATLALATLGVVYGDIGTSPPYAFREAATAASVYGVLSLVLRSLILVVSVKYVVFIMRLDNLTRSAASSTTARSVLGPHEELL
jgi:KUP system potassium uptake protein